MQLNAPILTPLTTRTFDHFLGPMATMNANDGE